MEVKDAGTTEDARQAYIDSAYKQIKDLERAKPVGVGETLLRGFQIVSERGVANSNIVAKLPLLKDLVNATRKFPVHPHFGIVALDLNFGVILSLEGRSHETALETKVTALEELSKIWKDAPRVARQYIDASVSYLFRKHFPMDARHEASENMTKARLDMRAYETELKSKGKTLPEKLEPDWLYALCYFGYPEHHSDLIEYGLGLQLEDIGLSAGENNAGRGNFEKRMLKLVKERYPSEEWVDQELSR